MLRVPGGGTAEDRLPSMNHHPKFGIREEALEAGVRTEVQMALNDPRSTPAYDGHPTMNLTSTQKGIFVTLVPAAPELPGDGAASSSAAASTEEGANSSAKKDVSILDAWKNRNSLVLGLCLLLNNTPKTVQLFLLDGTPTGPIKCSLSNWTGRVFLVPRTNLKPLSKQRPDLSHNGVYLLFGSEETTDREMVYVGQARSRANGN